ncbi:MAG: response regulator [Ginsengibacter sp.]
MTTDTENKSLDVLIVEDEPDICYLLSSILKKRNLHTTYVTTLFAAQKELNIINPDILIIDNHLPDGFGVDFILHLKRTHPHTKIVMITAHDTLDDKSLALKHGVDYFIGKPFTGTAIIETVDILLQSIIK